jgi:flagellar biosynthetic protein FlhB
MAGDAGEAEDKTEAPSSRRLEQAREEGRTALSAEAAILAVVAATTLMLAASGPALSRAAGRLALILEQAHRLSPMATARAALADAAMLCLPLLAAVLVAGAGAVLFQTGGLFNAKALAPDVSRLNPAAGLKRMVSPTALLDLAMSLLKLTAAGLAGWWALAADWHALEASAGWDAATLLDRSARVLLHAVAALMAAQAVITVLDILRARLKHVRGLRMSRHDIKEEARESDGDPFIKGRLKRIRTTRARRRMLTAVPKATVVVTNPTHYAVALAYDRGGNGAPRVVAKGVDEMAARIRAIAADNRIPVVPNPPLARALHKVELDREIPAEHFKEVAELIAYVWRLRTSPGSGRPGAAR